MNARLFALIAVVAVVAAGCSSGSGGGSGNSTTTSTTTTGTGTTSATATTSPVPAGNATNGKQIFSANCAQCHGATGTEGGVGPSLKNETSRKNFAQTVAWIKNPTPPMPKLYPSPLSAKDVNDVAAYVQSL
jgi:mono/diheme cytochrome c family protein